MMQCIDSLVQKVQSGVVINFEKIGPDPPPLAGDPQHMDDLEENEDETMTNGSRAPYPPNSASASVGNAAWHSCRKLIYVPRS